MARMGSDRRGEGRVPEGRVPITTLCQVQQVSPSGFYASRRRPESTLAQTDRRLRPLVRASFDQSRQWYGSPRIHEDLIEQDQRTRHLAIRALAMALKRRCPDAGLLHHSDQGSPYASEDYQTLLEARAITCSMSRRGNCYDNTVMESFFSTVRSEPRDHF